MGTRYDWWSYVKGMIRRYPDLCARHEERLEQRITPSYSARTGGNKAHRTTEETAVRVLRRTEEHEFQAVNSAIRQTMGLQTGELRLALIELMYWRGERMADAADKVYVSYRTARRWNVDFIYLVARKYGLLD